MLRTCAVFLLATAGHVLSSYTLTPTEADAVACITAVVGDAAKVDTDYAELFYNVLLDILRGSNFQPLQSDPAYMQKYWITAKRLYLIAKVDNERREGMRMLSNPQRTTAQIKVLCKDDGTFSKLDITDAAGKIGHVTKTEKGFTSKCASASDKLKCFFTKKTTECVSCAMKLLAKLCESDVFTGFEPFMFAVMPTKADEVSRF